MRNWPRFIGLLVVWLLIGLFIEVATTSPTGQLNYAAIAAWGFWVALWTVGYWLRDRAGVETSGWLNFFYGPAGIIRDIVVSARKLRRNRAAADGVLRVDGLQARPIDMHYDPAHQILPPRPAPPQASDLTWGNAAPGPNDPIPPPR